jgi:hypothetical protein
MKCTKCGFDEGRARKILYSLLFDSENEFSIKRADICSAICKEVFECEARK